jgi:hypothetical protein
MVESIQNVIAKMASTVSAQFYEIRPRRDKRGVDLISDALPFGRLGLKETARRA